MVREISKDDAVVVRSSIALLQERFRELQRVKAMREQREVLRLLALSEPNHSMNYEPAEAARLFFHPNDHHHVQLVHGHGSSSSPSFLSLWPALELKESKHEEEEEEEEEDYIHKRRRRSINEIPLLINLGPHRHSHRHFFIIFDTSLHL
ncbi:hypothetical protein M0R45_012751 [Rubus argutus]|uniref:Uncharacterized protein n=1 Tax=Rubus argutus TaxID=59490 RepID=A0AAW1XGT4_RUBAR